MMGTLMETKVVSLIVVDLRLDGFVQEGVQQRKANVRRAVLTLELQL